MRKTLTLIVMLLTFGFWAFAQSYPSQSDQSNQSQTSNAKQMVRGCLSGSGGSYTLTSDSGTKYQLSGDTSKLSDHVGHEVEITGTSSAASTASSSSSAMSNPSSGSNSNSEMTLNVSKIKHISPTCSSASDTMKH
jgi:hypothetical protein